MFPYVISSTTFVTKKLTGVFVDIKSYAYDAVPITGTVCSGKYAR